MDGFLTLKQAIPRGEADEVAYRMGVVGATVRAWCREPGTDDDANTGKRSPLDRVCDLITAVCEEVDLEHGRLIVEHVKGHFANQEAKAERKTPISAELQEKVDSAQLLLSQISNDLRAQRREKLQAVR
jgi:hypothetical protein